jgi:hypothetical protein
VSALVLLLSVDLLYWAVNVAKESPPNYFASGLDVLLALAMPVAIFFYVRMRVRSQMKASIEENSWGEASFSSDAINFRGPHGSAQIDWTPVKWARSIPEGVEICIGKTTYFYSQTYFAHGDFDRFLQLLRDKLGPRAKF